MQVCPKGAPKLTSKSAGSGNDVCSLRHSARSRVKIESWVRFRWIRYRIILNVAARRFFTFGRYISIFCATARNFVGISFKYCSFSIPRACSSRFLGERFVGRFHNWHNSKEMTIVYVRPDVVEAEHGSRVSQSAMSARREEAQAFEVKSSSHTLKYMFRFEYSGEFLLYYHCRLLFRPVVSILLDIQTQTLRVQIQLVPSTRFL